MTSVIDGVSCWTELLLTGAEVDNAVLLITAVAGACAGALVAGEANELVGLEADVVLVIDIEDGMASSLVLLCTPAPGRAD